MADVWRWNAKTYGIDHAESYSEFLEDKIEALGTDPEIGRNVAGRAGLRQLVVRRSTGGHGHIAFYRVANGEVRIVRVLHTARNWPNLLEGS